VGEVFLDEQKRVKQNESVTIRREDKTKVKYKQSLDENKTSIASASVLDAHRCFLFWRMRVA
jgi:hypothetical protein